MKYWEPEGFHRLNAEEYGGTNAADVLERMKEATSTSSLKEPAIWLGIRMSWLADAKRRNIIPIRWLQILVLKHSDYAPMWVLTGRGEKLWSGYAVTGAGLRSLQMGYYILPDPPQQIDPVNRHAPAGDDASAHYNANRSHQA